MLFLHDFKKDRKIGFFKEFFRKEMSWIVQLDKLLIYSL